MWISTFNIFRRKVLLANVAICLLIASFVLRRITVTHIQTMTNYQEGVITSHSKATDGYDIVIVGAGLSGAVMAYLHATVLHKKVLVIEKRDHIAGNTYDYINEAGIRVSKYGAHLFHTKYEEVWNFVQKFSEWVPYEHRVIAKVDNKYVPVPVNIDTVQLLLDRKITNPSQMKEWLKNHQLNTTNPKNGEEAALSRVGKELYEKMFKPYTYKQWSKYPEELNASVLLRIPVSDNFDDRYFPADPFQALPKNGYTAFVRRMLAHKNISIMLNTDYFELKKSQWFYFKPEKTIYTGPIDHYFSETGLPKLEYRSIHFESITIQNKSFYQPNSVVNYPGSNENFTRIVEYKHLLAQNSPHTTIVKEFSRDTGDPYYPVPNQKNLALYNEYKKLAAMEERTKNVHFVGRLANYKYFNMDQAILNVFNIFSSIYNIPTGAFIEQEPPHNYTKKISLTIIVNHCKERLSWLKRYQPMFKRYDTKVIVYEKCKMQHQTAKLRKYLPNLTQFILPNVGREGHSWIDFMLSKQSLFSDLNLFIQASPHHGFNRVFKTINTLVAEVKHLKAVENLNDDVNRGRHFRIFGSYNECVRMGSTISPKRFPRPYFIKLSRQWMKRFTNRFTKQTRVTFTGEFVVTDATLRRTLAKLRTPLERMYEALSINNSPMIGHILERLWRSVFTQRGCWS